MQKGVTERKEGRAKLVGELIWCETVVSKPPALEKFLFSFATCRDLPHSQVPHPIDLGTNIYPVTILGFELTAFCDWTQTHSRLPVMFQL